MNDLDRAIKRVEELARKYDADSKRAILFVAYDRELGPDDDTVYVATDPYTMSDDDVLATFAALASDVTDEAYEQFKGEDHETLDGVTGGEQAVGEVLEILRHLKEETEASV